MRPEPNAEPNLVYLSKSNHSNPDQVMKVRVWLEQKGFSVIEHKGGDYKPQLLRHAQNMVMVGCNSIQKGFVNVGKGQYEQLRTRLNHDFNLNFYVSNFIYGNPVLRRVKISGVVDSTDWTHGYGKLEVNMHTTVRLNVRMDNPYGDNDYSNLTELAGGENFSKLPDTKTHVVQHCSNDMTSRIHLACITLLK